MTEYHKGDSAERVCFYEPEFYCLSNFSAFRLMWKGVDFDTLEHAYHWEKFGPPGFMGSVIVALREQIREARSAHEAFQIAQVNKGLRRPDWDNVKVSTMLELMIAKADQHEYVARKLEQSGDRRLIEDSWRDEFWGWGPDCDGLNMAGELWMKVRELRREIAR